MKLLYNIIHLYFVTILQNKYNLEYDYGVLLHYDFMFWIVSAGVCECIDNLIILTEKVII